jgi:hypothetical protein
MSDLWKPERTCNVFHRVYTSPDRSWMSFFKVFKITVYYQLDLQFVDRMLIYGCELVNKTLNLSCFISIRLINVPT